MLSRYFVALAGVGAAAVVSAHPASGQVDPLPPILPGQMVVLSDQDVLNHGDSYYVESVVGTTTAFSFTIQNEGPGYIYFESDPVSLTALHAADFSTSELPFTLEPNGVTILSCAFTPGAVGGRGARLHIRSNSSDPPQITIQLVGTGLEVPEPVVHLRDPLEGQDIEHGGTFKLHRVTVGESGDSELEITNVGTADLHIGEPYVQGDMADDVHITGGPVTIAPNRTRVLGLTYVPRRSGPAESELVLPNNSAAPSFKVRLLARAIDDCDGNERHDGDEISDDGTLDCDADGRLDVCEQDTDGDGFIDDCDRCPGEDDGEDVDASGFPDCLEQLESDCNDNGEEDADEIAADPTQDCDDDGKLDACEDDADGDGVTDDCDRCPGRDDNEDLDGNARADCLEPAPDAGGGVDGDVDPARDCNFNGIEDEIEIVRELDDDCNDNLMPDSCEDDSDADDVIDDCDVCPGEDDLIDADDTGVPDCLERLNQGRAPMCGAGGASTLMPLLLGLMFAAGHSARRRRSRSTH